MANPHTQIVITKFNGLLTEIQQEFESRIRRVIEVVRRVIEVANISKSQLSVYLQIHMRFDTLLFFLRLDDLIRKYFDGSLRDLKNHFCNPNLMDMKMIQLEASKYDSKNFTLDFFWLNSKRVLSKFYQILSRYQWLRQTSL